MTRFVRRRLTNSEKQCCHYFSEFQQQKRKIMANKETEKPIFVNRDLSIPSAEYKKWIGELTKRYKQSQVKAAIKVNEGMLRFYWSLGRDIMLMKAEAKWGTSVLKNLSLDLQHEFPHSRGLSYTNLKYARQWYAFYNSSQVNRQQLVGDLEMPEVFAYVPWGHHISIISKSESIEEAMFYIHKVVSENLSRNALNRCLDSHLYEAVGSAHTNFSDKLPAIQGNLAKEVLKSPYNLDFMQMQEEYSEREFEEKLSRHITEFLLELGQGFAYVARQKELVMPSGKVYRPDMIFYHIKLRCYVVIELKVVDFEPEFAGKLNFYVSAVDELMKGADDNPTIGLLICKHKDDMTVEWAFKGVDRPLGVAEYENEILKAVEMLPTPEEIKENLKLEAELDEDKK